MAECCVWATTRVVVGAGVDPTANQDDDQPATDRETFQLEFDAQAEQWRVRTADNQYWSVEAAGLSLGTLLPSVL